MPPQTSRIPPDTIRLKRAYQPVASDDGLRVLVDRLWARGVSKVDAHLAAWMKELGPSNELRQWFGHEPMRWTDFQQRYQRELAAPSRQLFLGLLRSAAGASTVTLVYGARDTQENEAVVIRDYLLQHDTPETQTGDTSLVLLAAVEAVAAARHSGLAPAAALLPFLSSTIPALQIASSLQSLRLKGDVREEPGGWQLTTSGQRMLRAVLATVSG